MAAAEVSDEKVVWKVSFLADKFFPEERLYRQYKDAKVFFDELVVVYMLKYWRGQATREGTLLAKTAENMVDQQEFYGGVTWGNWNITLTKMVIRDSHIVGE